MTTTTQIKAVSDTEVLLTAPRLDIEWILWIPEGGGVIRKTPMGQARTEDDPMLREKFGTEGEPLTATSRTLEITVYNEWEGMGRAIRSGEIQ